MATAQLTWWTAEINRNREAQPEPYTLEQFYCFAPVATGDGKTPVPEEAGAAALALMGADLFPVWAADWVNELAEVSDDHDPPELWALVAPDALLLAPRPAPGGGWRGYLLADPTASHQQREFLMLPAGDPVTLRLPGLSAGEEVQAVAGACLTIPESEPAQD